MQNQVTAKVKHLVNLRNERIKPTLVEYLPGVFQEMKDNKPVQYVFFDDNGNPAESFVINSERVFDIENNPNHKRNWEILKIFLAFNPDYSSRIELNNPNEKAERQMMLDQQSYLIQSELTKIKNNSEALKKIYRRVIGLIAGSTEAQMYVGLWEASKTQQDKFKINGNSIFVDPELELYALIDLCVEKGNLLLDSTDGSIRMKNKKLLANSADDLVFMLKTDPELKNELEVLTKEISLPKSDVYSLDIDKAGLAAAMDQYGEELDTPKLNEDLSVNKDQEEDTFELEMNANIEILIDRGFIVPIKNGKKFSFPTLPGHEFKREELASHFKSNRPHYTALKQQAELK